MPYYVWGAVGAVAPEVVRWYRIRRGSLAELWRWGYWFATVSYVGLGVALSDLLAKPEADAAFAVGLVTEFAILGGNVALDGLTQKGPLSEEFESRQAGRVAVVLQTLRSHSRYLVRYG